mmetsp:Transcript_17984/g.23436  ORF Transcript_17984/g.23436 Transcript_17984/m.23436 type:complete len:368 (-) Transcript_17984:117-1220(-)
MLSILLRFALKSNFIIVAMDSGDDQQPRRRQKPNQRGLPNRFKNIIVPRECREHIVTEFPILQNLVIENNGTIVGGSAWKTCNHLKLFGLHFPVFFARYLTYALKPTTVLQFGCGLGTIADFLARHVPGGTRVVCIENEPMLGDFFLQGIVNKNLTTKDYPFMRRYPARAMQIDLEIFSETDQPCTKAFVDSKEKFELVLCLEVAEHYPPEKLDQLLDWLVSITGKYLIFSAARPNQAGKGHFEGSMKAATWWVRQFHKRGMLTVPDMTRELRQTANPERYYDLAKNTLVFRVSTEKTQDDSLPPPIADCRYYHAPECPRTKLGVIEWKDSLGLWHQRQSWVEGNWQALWPEVDILVRRLREGELSC